MSVFSKIRQAFRARAIPFDPPILVSSAGFTVSGHFISWLDIHEISAYKIDLLTTDEVRLSLFASSGREVTVSEEQAGFGELTSHLVAAFPSIAGWQNKVINHAFASNHTVLYRRT